MFFPPRYGRISRLYSFAIRFNDGPCQSPTIQDWPEPRKIKEIQSFLGFTNFYHRFIHAYSDIVIPLTRLTHKDTKWDFSEKCRKVFNDLKTAFLSAPLLTHWIPDIPNHRNGCLRLCNCSDSIHRSPRWRNSPSCFPFMHPNLSRTKL